MIYKKFMIVALAVLTFCSCNNFNKVVKEGDPKAKLQLAMEYYENEDYYRALQLFDNLIVAYRGSVEAEKIYYYYAWCNFYQGDYALAAHHFTSLAKTFPNSKYIEECVYQSAYCKYLESPESSLDQTSTKAAINDLQLFINKYPKSERVQKCNELIDELRAKLEKKYYDIAKLYYDIEEYKAAIVAMNNLLKDFPGTKSREEIMFYIVKSNYYYANGSVEKKKAERYKNTVDACENMIKVYPESKFLKDVMNIKNKANHELANK